MSLVVSALRHVRKFTDALGVDIGTDLAPLIATAPSAVIRHEPDSACDATSSKGFSIVTIQVAIVGATQRAGILRDVIVAIPGGAYRGAADGHALGHLLVDGTTNRCDGRRTRLPVGDGEVAQQARWSLKIANLISDQIASHPNGRVGVYGDSAGGGLALSAIQRLVADNEPVPASLVLVSPLLDVTMSNPAIASVDDPVLDAAALRESGLKWAGPLDPKDPSVSPLYGSLERLPPTYVYSGSLDVLYPDVLVLQATCAATRCAGDVGSTQGSYP